MQTGASRQEIRVNAGVSSGKPGDPVDIPLTLSGSEQVQVREIVAEIRFPKKPLSFVRIERGLAGELSEATVAASVKEDGNDPAFSLLEVTVSAEGPIHLGILAYLKFRLSTEASKGVLALRLGDSKSTTVEGEPFPMAKGKDGEVTVIDPAEETPFVGCFFFTH